MSALDEVFDNPQPAGVLAVLDAADVARDQLSAAQYLASFAPAPIFHGQCPCGSVMEVRPTDGRDVLTAEDHAAIADWDYAHDCCYGDDGSDWR